MLMTAERARELATLANNESNKLVTIEEEINKAVDKGKMYICYRCTFVIIVAFPII